MIMFVPTTQPRPPQNMRAIQKKKSVAPTPEEECAKNWFTDKEYLARVKKMDVAELYGNLTQYHSNLKSKTIGTGLAAALLQVEGERERELRDYKHGVVRGRDADAAESL